MVGSNRISHKMAIWSSFAGGKCPRADHLIRIVINIFNLLYLGIYNIEDSGRAISGTQTTDKQDWKLRIEIGNQGRSRFSGGLLHRDKVGLSLWAQAGRASSRPFHRPYTGNISHPEHRLRWLAVIISKNHAQQTIYCSLLLCNPTIRLCLKTSWKSLQPFQSEVLTCNEHIEYCWSATISVSRSQDKNLSAIFSWTA